MYEIPFTEKCAIASLHLINTACRVLVVLLTTFRLKTANRRDSIVECSAPWHGLPVRIGNHFEVNCQFHQVKGSSLWGYCFRSVECLLITRGSMWFGCSCFFYRHMMHWWASDLQCGAHLVLATAYLLMVDVILAPGLLRMDRSYRSLRPNSLWTHWRRWDSETHHSTNAILAIRH